MPTDLTPPDPNPILELISAFRCSAILFAACELKVFDALAEPKSLATLAVELKCSSEALERLLNGCAMLGLLAKTGDTFANTPAAALYLRNDSPNQLLGYLHYSNDVLWKLWHALPDAVREGTHRWKQVFGSDGPIFSSIFRTDAEKQRFLFGMHSYGLISSPQVVNAVDLSGYSTFCDLGGATGHLAIAACRRWPNLTGIAYDLPEVVGLTKAVVDEANASDRVAVVGGNFFTDELPKADVYALGRILHDWTEAKIEALLAKIYAALPTGGAILIAEKVLHDDGNGPDWSVLQSLNMLIVTEGKERTLGQYAALLERAGFRDVVCHRTAAPLDAVLAKK